MFDCCFSPLLIPVRVLWEGVFQWAVRDGYLQECAMRMHYCISTSTYPVVYQAQVIDLLNLRQIPAPLLQHQHSEDHLQLLQDLYLIQKPHSVIKEACIQ